MIMHTHAHTHPPARSYHWWNTAHNASLAAHAPRKRMWSLNRAFTAGAQRLGTVVWTGDISVSWLALATTPSAVLNWVMAGAPFVACDIGGFEGGATPPALLTRWYQLGVFLPVMRVHSRIQVCATRMNPAVGRRCDVTVTRCDVAATRVHTRFVG